MKGGSQIGLEKLRISLSARDDLARRESLLTHAKLTDTLTTQLDRCAPLSTFETNVWTRITNLRKQKRPPK